MPSHHIRTSHFANYWREMPDLVSASYEEVAWVAEGLDFCETTLGYLPPIRYNVERSIEPGRAWRESVIADFATDADLVAFRLRFPEA